MVLILLKNWNRFAAFLATPLVSIREARNPLDLIDEAEMALEPANKLEENDVLSKDEASSVLLYTRDCLCMALSSYRPFSVGAKVGS